MLNWRVPRFRIIKEPPGVLKFRNGIIRLADTMSTGSHGLWVAQREDKIADAHVLCSSVSLEDMRELRANGFEVLVGSNAERIMLLLVRLGYAERLA